MLNIIPHHIVRYALTTLPFFRFDNLKKYCPNLRSYKEFISSNEYLGSLGITLKGSRKRLGMLTNLDYLRSVQGLLTSIEKEIKANKTDYEGSPYISKYLHDIFGTKEISFPKDAEREKGQEEELADKDWYAYNANYGTSEERAFISLFARLYENFKQKYDDIYVIRNEKVVKILTSMDEHLSQTSYYICVTEMTEILCIRFSLNRKATILWKKTNGRKNS